MQPTTQAGPCLGRYTIACCCTLLTAVVQATYSLLVNRPQSFSLLEDLGKLLAR